MNDKVYEGEDKSVNRVSIIIPAYNEEDGVGKQITEIQKVMNKTDWDYELIIVNDGSTDRTLDTLKKHDVIILNSHYNRGYGASLKTGIVKAKNENILITDADGTYPAMAIPELLEKINDFDMVIGARDWNQISAIRKFPKRVLTYFASFLAGYDIPDLNSGMRVFKKRLALKFWHLYPDGFSFTSTITMGAITNDYDIYFHQIDYYSRIGDSSIHPIKDTIRFFTLVTRLAIYFKPKKFFVPVSIIFFALGMIRGLRDYLVSGALGGVSIILFFFSVQTFFFGILAEIINKTRIYLSKDDN